MRHRIDTLKPGRPEKDPPQRRKCGWCGGTGEEPVDPADRRAGTKACTRCHGDGEL